MHQAGLFLKPASDAARAMLVQVLGRDHRGSANGIGAKPLAEKLGIHERQLRTLVSLAREDGVAIVGTPETGYFIAETALELEQCCAFLRARAMHSLRIESRLRNIPLPDLLGQLHLNT